MRRSFKHPIGLVCMVVLIGILLAWCIWEGVNKSNVKESTEIFWLFIQSVVTTIGVLAALIFPTILKRKDDLEKLVAIRNIAFFQIRFLKKHMAPQFKEGQNIEKLFVVFNVCQDALKLTEYTKVKPAHLIENFVDTLVASAELIELFKSFDYRFTSIGDYIPSKVDGFIKRLDINLKSIDDHLDESGSSRVWADEGYLYK